MATLHLIHGFVGAGKTTFSKELEQKIRAVRLTPDEWMCELYGVNPPAEMFAEYDRRVKDLMWKLVGGTLAAGADVILDYGFWKKAERDDYRARARAAGAEVKLYALQCPDDVMHARVLKRTEELPPGALVIDENAIAEFRLRFEPVDPSEEDCIVVPTG